MCLWCVGMRAYSSGDRCLWDSCLQMCLWGVWIRACSSRDGCLWGNCLCMCLWDCLSGVCMHACNSAPEVLGAQILNIPRSACMCVCVQWYVIVCVCVHICMWLQITQYACVQKYAPIPVCARACMQKPTTWQWRDGVELVCLDQYVTPATKIDQCTPKTRGRHASAKCFVLDHLVSRPDKISPHVLTCPQDARRRRALSRMQQAACSNAYSHTRACISGAVVFVSDCAAVPEATHSTREHKHAGQRGQGTRTTRGPRCCVQCEQHAC